MSHQFPLDLKIADRFSRDRFVSDAGLNSVLDVLLRPETWIAPHLVLLGPKGSGKTHLGHIFAAETGARFVTAAEVPEIELDGRGYVIDDADQASEEALFHLYNSVQISGQPLVLLTEIQPLQWQVSLADLRSRLGAMRVLSLPEPDDALLSAILNKLFAERAISPSPDAVAYIAGRMERNVAAAQKIVTELMHYANGRAFNRGLARDFFEDGDSLPFDDGDDR